MSENLWIAILALSALVVIGVSCTEPDSGQNAAVATEGAAAAAAPGGLATYDGPAENIPVTARYPETMDVIGVGSGEGVGVFFTFKPQGNALDEAQVHVFLPANASSIDELMSMVTGAQGLIESNGWTLVGTRAEADPGLPYPWIEQILDLSTDVGQSGHILVGQAHGQAIRVTLLYPAEMADAYWPSARTILDSLDLDADLLPVTTSG